MMQDDIRELVHGSSPPRPDAKSLKSRSKSTTAKSSKKKKKSSDSKSKSKSTTTAKKKREKGTSHLRDPATLTIQVPPMAAPVSMATLTAMPLPTPLPVPNMAVSENLREVLNDPTIPVATPSTDVRADTHVDGEEKEKASKPRKKKESKRASSASKRKEEKKKKQSQEQQQDEEEREEKRKRRERLLVSPFEFLHITPFRHSEDEFHDDISFLTLPKPLRDQDAKSDGKGLDIEEVHHLSQVAEETVTPEALMPNNQTNDESNDTQNPKPPAIDASNTSAEQAQPSPAPGWARKSKPEPTSTTKEQASTDLSYSPEISSIPSAHPRRPSPVILAMTTRTDTYNTPQLETRNEENANHPKNHLPPMEPPMDEAKTVQVVSPKTTLPTLDRTKSWSHADQSSSDPKAPTPHLTQESSPFMTEEKTGGKGKFTWLIFTQWRHRATSQLNNDIESGNVQPQIRAEENKTTRVHQPVKKPLWFMASAATCFVFLGILTIILVIILAKR